jgi:hypothetical protein
MKIFEYNNPDDENNFGKSDIYCLNKMIESSEGNTQRVLNYIDGQIELMQHEIKHSDNFSEVYHENFGISRKLGIEALSKARSDIAAELG